MPDSHAASKIVNTGSSDLPPADEAPEISGLLHRMATSLLERYLKEWRIMDLEVSIGVFHVAKRLRPEGHPNRSKTLNNLAIAMFRRYDQSLKGLDLSKAIALHREALNLRQSGSSSLAHLESTFQLGEEQAFPNKTVPKGPNLMDHAADPLIQHHKREGEVTTLAEAIHSLEQALALRPPGHPNRSFFLDILAAAIHTRYKRDGEGQDLSDLVNLYREALSLRPPGHPNRSESLHRLATAIYMRYRRSGGEGVLSEVIDLYREALSLRPPGHPDRASSLHNLASAIHAQYNQEGIEQNLLDAINLQKEALSLFPPGHPDRSVALTSIAVAILSQYMRYGADQDLLDAVNLHKEALSLRPPGHPDRWPCLNNLASAIHTQYHRNGGEETLSEVIYLYVEALFLSPPGHPDRSTSLNNLAIAIHARYKRHGGYEDLSGTIILHKEALSLQASDHPSRSTSLSHLATAIVTRYKRDGREPDLSDGIDLHREALSLRPPGHCGHSDSLHNLASAIYTRYMRDKEDQDLADAINLHEQALSLTPTGHPDRSESLHNLASVIYTQYQRAGGDQDLSDVIDLHKQALSLVPSGHASRSSLLSNLAVATAKRYEQEGKKQDLTDAINLHKEALSLRPPGHPGRSASFSHLASAIMHHIKIDQELNLDLLVPVMRLLQEAATAGTSPVSHRLTAAQLWIVIATILDDASTLKAYRYGFALMGCALALSRSLQARHTNLLLEGPGPLQIKGLATEAATWALSKDSANPKLAIELLDQGRNALLASVGQFRANISDVRQNDPVLAEEFYRIGRILDSAIVTGQDISERKSYHEDPLNRYNRFFAEWEAVVAKIRLLPGCESFLLPQPYVKLQEAAAGGPVIVIIVGEERSTAIIVMFKGEPHTVDLPDASEEALKSLHEDWEDALKRLPDESRVTRKLPGVLSKLWSTVVKPIMHELKDSLQIPLQSRIWWYPTSWASFLPLHAAGSYKKNGENVPDLYISSYTPTLQTLSQARRDHSSTDSNTHSSLLMVSQPEAEGQDEIVGVNAEVEVVQRLVMDVTLLSGDQGTKDNALQEMRNKSWIHLACHGVPNSEDPFQSHFALHGGPLSLQDIITNQIPSAEFAYLSACHSAAQDRKLPDEGLTLAGGMRFAGFKSVVGTLWKMADEDAPTLARVFYESLGKRSGEGKAFDCTKTAEALHDAVKELRRKKLPLFRWVNLVHYGI